MARAVTIKAWNNLVDEKMDLIAQRELLQQENAALRKHVEELEERLALESQFTAVKIGGFNYLCAECHEKFDVPGRYMRCPYCKSIKVRVIS